MLLGAVTLFLIVREVGETLVAPAPGPAALGSAATSGAAQNVLLRVLLALTAVVAVGQVLGRAFIAIGQPPVIGEVLGGVLLGPSLLGAVAPAAYHFLLPPGVMPYLGIVAQLGVILYMFRVGLELNPELLRGQVHATVATS